MKNKTGLRKNVRSREASGLGRVTGPEVSMYFEYMKNKSFLSEIYRYGMCKLPYNTLRGGYVPENGMWPHNKNMPLPSIHSKNIQYPCILSKELGNTTHGNCTKRHRTRQQIGKMLPQFTYWWNYLLYFATENNSYVRVVFLVTWICQNFWLCK